MIMLINKREWRYKWMIMKKLMNANDCFLGYEEWNYKNEEWIKPKMIQKIN